MKKQLYNLLCACGILFITTNGNAQCLCSPGVPATPIIQTITISPTSNFSNDLIFTKFSMPMAFLKCATLEGTFSTEASLGIRNRDSLDRYYKFKYSQYVSITGPGGLFVDADADITYGPQYLSKYGQPGDSTMFGPDTTLRNVSITKNITNPAFYEGTGNVVLTLTNTGSTLLQQGSNNYTSSVKTSVWGEFKMTYYWCESVLLADDIKNFIVTSKNNKANISWEILNDEATNSYEILISTDGKNFTKTILVSPQSVAEGTATKYAYQYATDQAATGKLYFRIKQISASGKVRFSTVQFINLSANAGNEVAVYPNPVTSQQLSLQFGQVLKGNYAVEVINLTGQVIYRNTFKLNNTNTLQLTLPSTPPSGLYHVRARGIASGEMYTNKLLVQH